MALTPSERSIRARIAAHILHAQRNPQETTAAARQAFLSSFELQADPTGSLDPAERKRRAQHLRKAYFSKLALASARARRGTTERKNKTKPPSLSAAGGEV